MRVGIDRGGLVDGDALLLFLQVVGALSAVAWTAVPMVVSLSTFACYTLLGNELTSAKYVLRIEIA